MPDEVRPDGQRTPPAESDPAAASAPDRQSFWNTGLGYLTQLAGVLGAIAGILAAVGAFAGQDSGQEQSGADAEKYRQGILDQCRAVNSIERQRGKASARIVKRTDETTPITETRDRVLVPLGDEIQATNHVRAKLQALTPPPGLASTHENVQGALKRLFDLLMVYRRDLRVAQDSRPAVSETIIEMEGRLPEIKEDQLSVTAGLEKLGGRSCGILQPSDDTGRVFLPAVSAG